ncbi:TraB/GumN family protein [Colwelliaceae bacterium BS250]
MIKSRKLISLTLLCLAVFNAAAKAPVWKVSKGDADIYVAGTVHVLNEADYPLPDAFNHAYEQSQIIVLEADMNLMQSPEFQLQMLKKMTYQNGGSYVDDLTPATVTRLNEFMQQRGIPVANVQTLKPSMLAITLTMVELQRLGLMGTGVDAHYQMRGLNDKKSFLYLETPEQQIDFIANMGAGAEDEMIAYTLDDMGDLAESFNLLKSAWRSGDSQRLYDVGAKEWQQQFPDAYNSMLIERNNNWMPHLEEYFASSEVELVLVGALHLVGEEGVIAQLKAKGYTVTQL